jgi:hypothetical protein
METSEEEEESHLVTLNEAPLRLHPHSTPSRSFKRGESFPYSHHKRWKIIMHIKVGSVADRGRGVREEKKIKRGKKWRKMFRRGEMRLLLVTSANKKKRKREASGKWVRRGEWEKLLLSL